MPYSHGRASGRHWSIGLSTFERDAEHLAEEVISLGADASHEVPEDHAGVTVEQLGEAARIGERRCDHLSVRAVVHHLFLPAAASGFAAIHSAACEPSGVVGNAQWGCVALICVTGAR